MLRQHFFIFGTFSLPPTLLAPAQAAPPSLKLLPHLWPVDMGRQFKQGFYFVWIEYNPPTWDYLG
jgi:hypothetical protein